VADGVGLTQLLRRRIPGTRLRVADVPIWLLGMLVMCLWAAPFVWMVSTSFKPTAEVMTKDIEWFPRTVILDNYVKVFEYPVVQWALNSVIQASFATALCVLSGAMAGYALARLRFPGRDLIFLVFLASLMVPAEITMVPMLIAMIRVGWANTYQALILPMIANVFSVYIFRQFFLTFPRELEDAALIDGAGRFQIFWRIAFPLARAPTIAATVIIFTLNWNNFLWPLLVTFQESMKTLPVGIAVFAPVVGSKTQIETFGIGMAAVTILSIPSLALFLGLQKYFIQGISAGSLKS
jgi:multiple sugar transport system permease protein